jgi:uncharacterized low-complexity protein
LSDRLLSSGVPAIARDDGNAESGATLIFLNLELFEFSRRETMSRNTLIATALSSAFVAGLSTAPAALAADNPFTLSGLSSGYQVADSHAMEGKCGGMKAGEGKCGMEMADTDKDGKVSKAEASKMHESMFAKADANKDGFIDKDEMAKMKQGKCGEGKCGAGMKK